MAQDPGQWTLSELQDLVETVEGDGHIISVLRQIVETLKEEQNPNFILGKVVITNDLLDDEDDEEDEEE